MQTNRILKPRPTVAAVMALAAAASPAWASGPALLAELSPPGGYTSWLRTVAILLAVLPWLAFCQWVDRDTSHVRRINRDLWNSIVLTGGAIGLCLWIFMPWQTAGLYAAGFGLYLVIAASSCASYVIVRNTIVDRSARVFTPRHIKAWFASLGKKKEAAKALIERVKLVNAGGKKVAPPTDPTQAEPFEAAQILLYDALWRRASEAQLVVSPPRPATQPANPASGGRSAKAAVEQWQPRAARLAYRIDGVVVPRHDLLTREHAALALEFIKQTAGLDVDERRRPQSGKLRGSIGSDRGMAEIEVTSMGTMEHEQLVLKMIGEETRLRIDDLGMAEPVQQRFESMLAQRGGLVLVSGPRASGVTTTLYACLRKHDAFMENLLTLERTPLMELENITQHIFDPTKQEGSYARQLQTVLRREPDVVLVSDCMDRETAHLAVSAAGEGKRIYMGIQARDSFDAIKKLLSLAGDTEGVGRVLRGVTSQRLIRKLCIACRIAYKPDVALLKKANLPLDKIESFYRQPKAEEYVDEKGQPRVCPNCQNSGFFGRTGVFEVLVVDEPLQELIGTGQPLNRIQAQARKAGMQELQFVSLHKVMSGTTSMNEMLRVLRDEEEGAARSARKAGS